jgi:metallo-beta-lactamase class B
MASIAEAPTQDLTVADGQRLTIGGTPIDISLTPGVTAGAMSLIFPVTDKGTSRMAAYHSSLAIPQSIDDKLTHLDSLARFGTTSQAAGVNVLLSSYQAEDLSIYNQDLLRHRRAFTRSPRSAADFQDAHPYLMTTSGYQNFLKIVSECTRVSAARNGQVLPR